jgi:hypothetical protein
MWQEHKSACHDHKAETDAGQDEAAIKQIGEAADRDLESETAEDGAQHDQSDPRLIDAFPASMPDQRIERAADQPTDHTT